MDLSFPDASKADTGSNAQDTGIGLDAGMQTALRQVGEPCTSASDCVSNICLRSGHAEEIGLVCSRLCMSNTECPSDWACRLKGETDNLCIFGVTSQEMASKPTLSIVFERRYNTGELQDGTLHAQQLIAGLQRDGWTVNDAASAIAMTDDGVRVYNITHQSSGDRYTHLRLYMGDTEVGYLYHEGTTTMVAYVSDQDINACIVYEAVDVLHYPNATATQNYCFPR